MALAGMSGVGDLVDALDIAGGRTRKLETPVPPVEEAISLPSLSTSVP